MSICSCGSGTTYELCCGRFISGVALPTSAEELLASRYTAYSQKNTQYVFETTHLEKREEISLEEITSWAEATEWLSFSIVKKHAEDRVEFVASYRNRGQIFQHHEIALFKKEGDRWFFFDSEFPKPNTIIKSEPKVGRNDPCSCGSGKKFKKCCGVSE